MTVTNRARRLYVVAQIKVLGLQPFSLHENRKPKVPWASFLMLYPCPGHTCRYQTTYCLRFSQCKNVPFSFFFFSLEGPGSHWMSQTHHRRPPLWTPMNMTLCWSFCVTHILAYSWRRPLVKKKHVTKMRFTVLKIIPFGIIPDTQTRLSDGCSGLTLFPSQRTVRHHTRQRSLQLVGTSCTFGVPFAAWEYLLLDGYNAR